MKKNEIEKIAKNFYVGEGGSITAHHLPYINSFVDGYSLGLNEKSGYELYGYLFEGKFYGDLEMLRNKTMSESNKPLPLFIKTDSEERDKDIKEKAIKFCNFLKDGSWGHYDKDIWAANQYGKIIYKTLQELYSEFIYLP